MDYIFKSISNAKEMIERKPNQSTVDYKIYGVLTDCETIIKELHKAINGFTANVVRCKDCKYCREAHYEEDGEPSIIKLKCENKYGLCRYQVEPNGFCYQAERKECDGDG